VETVSNSTDRQSKTEKGISGMFHIVFEYCDILSGNKWIEQECVLSGKDSGEAVAKCKKFYGLDMDCEYRIVKVEKR
jgi:hypothetical protein